MEKLVGPYRVTFRQGVPESGARNGGNSNQHVLIYYCSAKNRLALHGTWMLASRPGRQSLFSL